MKILLFSLFIYLPFSVNSQNAEFKIINCHPIIDDYVWAAETEVSNFQYREFLLYLKRNEGDSAFVKNFPDSTCWVRNNYSKTYQTYYFTHPAYRDYPVVGVSHEQAQRFCSWLTMILNLNLKEDLKHPVAKVKVRLPNEKEWELAAKGGNPNAEFPWPFSDMRNEEKKFKGQLMANFVRGRSDYVGVAGNLNDNADLTAPIRSYWPNDYGLYNMAGNVAEMLDEKGKTKGGSWASRATNLRIENRGEFSNINEPDSRIGFRYFVEIVSYKNRIEKKQYDLDVKAIESMLVYVPAKTYKFVSQTEVTNEIYNYYLKETGKTKNKNQNSWKGNVNYSAIWENDYDENSKYSKYPVVNISQEEAQEFCEWLTSEYAKMRKTKYKGIEFRLPTIEEWEYAARGDLELSQYPWGGPYVKNAEGSFLANHRSVFDKWILDYEDQFLIEGLSDYEILEASRIDGHEGIAPAISYNPNGWGLYNMSGNVSEIVQSSGIVKGGSWTSYQQALQINSQEKMTKPSVSIGFRIFASFPNESKSTE